MQTGWCEVMKMIEIFCRDKNSGILYRRLIRESSIREIIENPYTKEVRIYLDDKKILFWRKRRYIILAESLESVKETLQPSKNRRL